MRNKYKVTFNNHNKECTLNIEVCKVIHASSVVEAKETCTDIYDDMNGHFRILGVVKI
jgi:hypothetical protein